MNHTRPAAHNLWCLVSMLLVAIGLVAAVPVVAQSARGTLTGTVKDGSGAFIPGATVTLKETNTTKSVWIQALNAKASLYARMTLGALRTQTAMSWLAGQLGEQGQAQARPVQQQP